MAIRKIMRLGHPVLRQVAKPIPLAELRSPRIADLVADMVETLHDYGGIGLAAPQIGESIRLLIIEIPGGPTRYGEVPALPLAVYANPEFEVVGDEQAGYWEGCLSVPGMRGYVIRPQHLRIRYFDLHGQLNRLELQGFQATVFQHEFDHLDGKLYVDRLIDPTKFAFEDEFLRHHTGAPTVE